MLHRVHLNLDFDVGVGVLAIGRDPGWVWKILCCKVVVSEILCSSRSLDLPVVVVVSLALPCFLPRAGAGFDGS